MSGRDEPRRLSVDLDPALYELFTKWADRAAEDTHVHRVKLTDALRAMITVTATDAEMSNAVVTEMTASKWTPR